MSGAVRFQLKPSPALAIAIVAGHIAAAAAVYMALPRAAGVALALALVALGAAAAWSRALLRSRSSVRAIEVGGPQATFELASGERLSAIVATRRYVTRHVVALPLRGGLGRTLLVTGDMLSAEEFRRLRIWALWNRLPAARPAVAPKQLGA
ncbi:MAG: hypothetical protein E6H77_05720 [Betaproteobacteria bacterium]|nr:MAG: hypothetical protein E6H77_05720 [Betaproteobacteria bacterium]